MPVLNSIQLLRGVAALLVVCVHARVLLNTPDAPQGGDVFRNGSVGVDIFFIISGFIIAFSTPKDAQVGYFLLKRLIRVVPLYWLATLVTALVTRPVLDTVLLQSLLFLPINNETPPAFGFPVMMVGWTLNYEMYFYGLFALSLVWRRHQLAILSGLIIGAVFLPQLVLTGSVTLVPREAPILAFPYLTMAINPLILEFLIGVTLARLYSSPIQLNVPAALVCSTVGLAVFLWCTFGSDIRGHGLMRLGIPAIALCISALLIERSVGFPKTLPGVALGNASYAIYLIHVLVIGLSAPYLAALGPAGFWVAVLLCITIGLAVHRWIERPLLSWLRRILIHDRS